MRVLPLAGSVQGNVLDICSSVVFSTDFPCKLGRTPDLPLLSTLRSLLGLPVLYQGMVLVFHTSFANASIGVVF